MAAAFTAAVSGKRGPAAANVKSAMPAVREAGRTRHGQAGARNAVVRNFKSE
jgi:hypothetical protein